MANFDEDIKRITNEILEDGTIDEIIRDKITDGFRKAIDDSFRFGELRKAVEKRVKEVLVPYIENYDLQEYVVKLDTVLSDIINSTNLIDNKIILENFSELMKEPEIKTITMSELFKKYKEYVSKNMDTAGRTIDYSDGVRYEGMEVSFDVEEEEDRAWNCFKYATLKLSVEDEEQQEDLNRTIKIDRYKNSNKEGWDIYPETDPTIKSLRYLNDFDLFLIKLHRADVKLIIDRHSGFDTVYSVNEPEATYE